MTFETAINLVKEACEKNITVLNLSNNELNQLPEKIKDLKNLLELDLSYNRLNQLPPEIKELKTLKELNLSYNRLNQLPNGITELENLTTLILSGNQLNQLPPEIGKLKNLTTLILSGNQLKQLPHEIIELKNLKELDLCYNQLNQLTPEIGELKNLTTLILSGNQLNQLTTEITELKNLKILNLYGNQLTQLPSEIGEFKYLQMLNILESELNQLPPEIGKLKNLTTLILVGNHLKQLPPEIGKLENLTKLIISGEIQGLRLRKGIIDLSENHLIQLPTEIIKLKNLTTLILSGKQLTQLPTEITEIENLTTLDLSYNCLNQLPPEIGKLKNLTTLILAGNHLNQLPPEITEIRNLTTLDLSDNLLISPPPEIVSRGLEAIFSYLKQSQTTENNEAKIIFVGNGDVGKTCLAHRLIYDKFLENSKSTEGINISKWRISAPITDSNEIKLNIWDFGGQEIYHATQQFFLTKRSVYLLVWNARKSKDYDNIYYWLHTIEAFGGDSPIILVMSKMNESNDDLNLKDLRSKFPQIVDYVKVDSYDGTGIDNLKEVIRRTAWNLPLMKAHWVDSWYKVRKNLERLGENWISYDIFYEICKSEGLDEDNINTLDGYLHDLGVILHFKDRTALKNIVILKSEWATNAFYKILSTKSVLYNEGILLQNELSQIWESETYPSSVYPQLMEIMNKFELSYELPDKSSYLIPELLPNEEPDNFEWNQDSLCFYYSYDYFMSHGIITRFIVGMHQDIEKKENGMPLCWRYGAVLKLQNSRALVKMKPDEKQIEIRIKGSNKRWALGAICIQLDQINASIKKIKVNKQVPCNCSDNCPERYLYDKLLKAELNNVETIQCHDSYKYVSVSLLLDGYTRKEERIKEYGEVSGNIPIFVISPTAQSNYETKEINTVKQKTNVNQYINVNVNLKIDLPQIQIDYDNLSKELKHLNSDLDNDLDKILDSLDEISINSDHRELAKPFNKLYRFLDKLSDPNSDYNKVITQTQKGIELAQKVGRTYNKFAQWLTMPQVPDLLVRK